MNHTYSTLDHMEIDALWFCNCRLNITAEQLYYFIRKMRIGLSQRIKQCKMRTTLQRMRVTETIFFTRQNYGSDHYYTIKSHNFFCKCYNHLIFVLNSVYTPKEIKNFTNYKFFSSKKLNVMTLIFLNSK